MEMQVKFHGGVKIDAIFNEFTFKTDQPVEDGGENTAPSPFLYFLASLASCAGFYVVSFCNERNIDTTGLALKMAWDWNEDTHRIDHIRLDLTLPIGFPEKYKPAVLRTVDLCTVKKHIMSPPEIKIELL